MYSEKSFKEVGKALCEEQTVNNPTERNTRLRPRGLGRQASSTRQSSGEQSTGQATASSARLQLTMDTYLVKVPVTGNIDIIPFDPAHSYEQLSRAVGGYLELAPIPAISTKEPYGIDCFVDEEGLVKIPPRELNPRLSAFAGQYLVGDAVFAGHDAMGETVGLTRADAEAIAERMS